jgi:hypothetical protein
MNIPVLSTKSNDYYNPHITEYHNKPHAQLLTVAYTILLLGASVSISSLLKPMYPNISGPSRTNQSTAPVCPAYSGSFAQTHPLATSHQKYSMQALLPLLSCRDPLLHPKVWILYHIRWHSPDMLRPVMHLCLHPHLLLLMQLSITAKLHLGHSIYEHSVVLISFLHVRSSCNCQNCGSRQISSLLELLPDGSQLKKWTE